MVRGILAVPGICNAVELGKLMREAALRGRVEVFRFLAERGANLNLPALSGTDHLLLMTPLCVAMEKKKDDLEQFLVRQEAVYDKFTACYLGDKEVVAQWVEGYPDLVNAGDSACDDLGVTPLDVCGSGNPAPVTTASATILIRLPVSSVPTGTSAATTSSSSRWGSSTTSCWKPART